MNTLQTLRRSGLDFKYTPTCDSCTNEASWFGVITCCGQSAFACNRCRAVVDRNYVDAYRARRSFVHTTCGRAIDHTVRTEWVSVVPA